MGFFLAKLCDYFELKRLKERIWVDYAFFEYWLRERMEKGRSFSTKIIKMELEKHEPLSKSLQFWLKMFELYHQGRVLGYKL